MKRHIFGNVCLLLPLLLLLTTPFTILASGPNPEHVRAHLQKYLYPQDPDHFSMAGVDINREPREDGQLRYESFIAQWQDQDGRNFVPFGDQSIPMTSAGLPILGEIELLGERFTYGAESVDPEIMWRSTLYSPPSLTVKVFQVGGASQWLSVRINYDESQDSMLSEDFSLVKGYIWAYYADDSVPMPLGDDLNQWPDQSMNKSDAEQLPHTESTVESGIFIESAPKQATPVRIRTK